MDPSIFTTTFLVVMFQLLSLVLVVAATTEGPCDILGAAGNPCVAAHSTTRALYAKYDGPLYNVTKPNGQVSFFVSSLFFVLIRV